MKRLALAVGAPMFVIIGARPALAVQNAPALSADAAPTPWWHYTVPGGIIALALLIAARMIVRELRRAHRADAATVELAAQLVSMSDVMVNLASNGARVAPAEAVLTHDAQDRYDDPAERPVVHPASPGPAPGSAPAPALAAAPPPAPQAQTEPEAAQFAAMRRVMELDQQRQRLRSELDWPSDAEIERFRAAHQPAEDSSW